MADLTEILGSLRDGDPEAVNRLVPLVYEELRRLATARVARERPGITLQATALVNETYLRLFGKCQVRNWENSRHFYGAAAEAMRRILVENARRRKTLKRGGQAARSPLEEWQIAASPIHPDIEALDEALGVLAKTEPEVAELLKLRYFAGLTNQQAAETLGISPRTAAGWWAFARAWLRKSLEA
jgi:RNA polymerase sigma factor (TIGR02999 family)